MMVASHSCHHPVLTSLAIRVLNHVFILQCLFGLAWFLPRASSRTKVRGWGDQKCREVLAGQLMCVLWVIHVSKKKITPKRAKVFFLLETRKQKATQIHKQKQTVSQSRQTLAVRTTRQPVSLKSTPASAQVWHSSLRFPVSLLLLSSYQCKFVFLTR